MITRSAESWPRAADHMAGVICSSSERFSAVFDACCSVLTSPVRAATHSAHVLLVFSPLSILCSPVQQLLHVYINYSRSAPYKLCIMDWFVRQVHAVITNTQISYISFHVTLFDIHVYRSLIPSINMHVFFLLPYLMHFFTGPSLRQTAQRPPTVSYTHLTLPTIYSV